METTITVELTDREKEVVEWAALGLSDRYIARELHISVRTLEVHIRNIYRKLGMKSRDELIVRFA